MNMPGGDFLHIHRKDFNKKLRHPFVIYDDFETLSKEGDIDSGELRQNEPCSFGLVVVNWQQQIIHSKFYRGNNPAQVFLEELRSLVEFLDNYLQENTITINCVNLI